MRKTGRFVGNIVDRGTAAVGRHIVMAAASGMVLAIFAVAPAQALPVLDQSNQVADSIVNSSVATGNNWAQTFTVGQTGRLTSVGVQVWKRIASVTGDVTLEIRDTSAGVPNADNSQSLFTGTIAIASIPDLIGIGGSTANLTPFIDVDVSSALIDVTAGDVLAISLRRTGDAADTAFWVTTGILSNPYPNGVKFSRTDQTSAWSPGSPLAGDQGFRTFVEPIANENQKIPEPSTLGILAVGLAGLIMVRRKRAA